MKKDIRNLIGIFSVALCVAFGVTGWFLYNYGPTGRYLAQNTLIDPQVLARLNYNDIDPRTNETNRYQFDKIVYAFWDKARQKEGVLEIAIPTYQKFYYLVLSDESLVNPSLEIENLFRKIPPGRLEVRVKTESQTSLLKDSKDLIRVEFANSSNYWRIKLQDEAKGAQWVYYFHKDIYQKTFELFIP